MILLLRENEKERERERERARERERKVEMREALIVDSNSGSLNPLSNDLPLEPLLISEPAECH